MYAEGPSASAPVGDYSDEERILSPDEFIDDVEAALMGLVQSNPLEQAGIEVTELSTLKIQARPKRQPRRALV
jgi:hypothetical protein